MTTVLLIAFCWISYPFCSIPIPFSGLDSAVSQFSLLIQRRKVMGTIYRGLLDVAPRSHHTMLIAKTKIQPPFECGSLTSVQLSCPSRQEGVESTTAELLVILGYLTFTRCTQDRAQQKKPTRTHCRFPDFNQAKYLLIINDPWCGNVHTMANNLTYLRSCQLEKKVGQVFWADWYSNQTAVTGMWCSGCLICKSGQARNCQVTFGHVLLMRCYWKRTSTWSTSLPSFIEINVFLL